MPLVVPGVTTKSSNSTEEWQNKLVGKKLHETEHNDINFSKKELPEEHRVISPGQMVTRDLRENRLNIYVDEQGTVTHVQHG